LSEENKKDEKKEVKGHSLAASVINSTKNLVKLKEELDEEEKSE